VFGFIAAAFIRNESAYEGGIITANSAQGPIECELTQMPF
jgi:hypothetical protein